MPQDIVVALVTAPSREEAESLARTLVAEHLAACANIVPSVVSVYRWKGSIETDEEVLLFLKTRRLLLDRLIERVQELHSYEVPEVIALPLAGGSADYVRWVKKETERAVRELPRDRRGPFGPGF